MTRAAGRPPTEGVAYSEPFSIRVRPDQLEQIDRLCARLGVGRSVVVRLALDAGLGGVGEKFGLSGCSTGGGRP